MTTDRYMEEDIYIDVRRNFEEVLGDYFQDINKKELIDYAVTAVYEDSNIEENRYYDLTDIKLAVQKSLTHHLYNPETRETRLNSLTLSLLEEITDYEHLELSPNESEIIFERTEEIYDREDVELTINKALLEFGYEFDPNHFIWLKIGKRTS